MIRTFPLSTMIAILLGVSALVMACGAEVYEEAQGATTSHLDDPSPGPQWLFNGYCGTPQAGACSDGAQPCPQAPVEASPCTAAGARCIAAENGEGARKKFVCAPGDRRVWAFNGYCQGSPGNDCTGKHPACPPSPAGQPCDGALAMCTNGPKNFVCVGAKNSHWVLAAHCGADGLGAPCDAVAAPACDVAAPAGQQCSGANIKCLKMTSATTGKIFACVER